MDDSLNPKPSKFGMPWYVILGILVLSMILFFIPGFRIFGLLICPCALGFGYWLCHKDPKEPLLILYDMFLPAEFDPGK